KSDTLQENNDALLKTTVNQFMKSDRQISLTSKIDILIEWDDSKSVAVLTPIPLEHVKARPDHINDSYVLEWNLETMIVSETGETLPAIKVMKQIYSKEEITTYADGEILPEYSYPNTLGIQRVVTIHIQDLAGQDDPLIGVLEYNISTLYKQALNALGVVVKLTGEPDKYATGAYKVPKEGITNEENEDGTGNTISVPQFIFDDPKATYGWTEPPKGIPEIISFLEILFWLFLEQTGTPEGTLSTVTGMNSTANQLQVFMRTIEARQNAQTEGIKEVLTVMEAVNNLNTRDKVELSGDIEWPEAFPDTTTIKEIIISLMQDTGMSDETKLELIKKRYLDDLPEWKVESKRIADQKKLEFEAEVNAHHDGNDDITEDEE
ncbi:hypothetical protein KAR91_58720, partial [Candidatus Pacearchaeota archaeon]|nr:hypothetical protein [Candidatus Pacearchaeota archaeon]